MININGKISIYIRKENKLENLKTGYGRLQWLKYELEDNKETVNIFVDEYKECKKIIELIKEIQDGSIDNLLIWSIDDIDKDADTYFPEFDKNIYQSETISEHEEKGIKYKHLVYRRKKL